jgi:hypothetical protein
MSAIYTNLQTGTITDNPLTNSATTVNSAAFATLPVIAAPDFMWLTLDPTSVAGTPEIVKITTHTNAATVCTIVRGQQTGQGGGAARQHLLSTKWAVAATANDLDDLPHRLLPNKGGLIVGVGSNVVGVQSVGANHAVFVADSAQSGGVRWANGLTTKGDLYTFDTNEQRLAVGADHSALVADSTQATGLRYAQGRTTKGDLATFDSNEQRLAVGANQQVLNADSTAGTGLAWTWNGIPVFATTAARDAAITSPTGGMVCYVDANDITEGIYTYNGTSWRKSSWNEPWGVQAQAASASTSGASNGLTGVLSAPSFTAVANRRYKITISWGGTTANTIGGVEVQIHRGTPGTQLSTSVRLSGGQSGQTPGGSYFVTDVPGAGAVVYAFYTFAGGAATVTVDNQYEIVVEDIGPNGVPA